jgi:hypothetical protein
MKYTINPMNFINANYNDSNISSENDVLIENKSENENDLVKNKTDVAIADNNIEILKGEETKVVEEKSEEIKTTFESDIKMEDTATIAKLEIENTLDLVSNPYLAYAQNNEIISLNTNSTANLFPDIDKQNKHYEAIEYFKNKSLISGYDDGNFYPENEITRIESLKILLNSYSYSPLQ